MLRDLATSIHTLQGILPPICAAAEVHHESVNVTAAYEALGDIAEHAQPICSLAEKGRLNDAVVDALRRAMSCHALDLSSLERGALGTVLSLLGGGE